MIDEHGISFLPLHSINEGKCTCGNEKCISPGKHPRIRKSWKKIASSDKSMLKTWNEKYGTTLNLGVCTGELPSGKHLVVLDFDTKTHPLLSKLPKTFNYKTGSGGHHFWFFSKKQVNNSISAIAEKVDVRGAGGYVVVPPSRHRTGGVYHFHENSHHEIAELPEWFFTEKKSGSIVRQGTGKQNKPLAHHWAGLSVPEIRARLDQGILIPNGVRNTTIHRLLSSDRAKGVLYKNDMWTNALKYRSLCEEPSTITDNELSHIASSAMKYVPYNNYEPSKVVDGYVKFMNKNEEKVNENWIRKLDVHFFGSMQKSSKVYVTLDFLMQQYDKFFGTYGVPHPPHYKSQLFARKLKELGFERKRTSSGNLWNVLLEITSPLSYTEGKSETPQEKDHELMSEENVQEVSVAPEQTTENSTEHDPEEVVQIREEHFIKNKKHPSDEKYAYFRTTYEYNKAYTEKTMELADFEMQLFSEGNLVQDPVATQQLFDSIEPEDIVGIGYEKFEVLQKDGTTLHVLRKTDNEERTFTFGELDFERSIGFAEILYRKEDGKYEVFGAKGRTVPVIFHIKRKDLKPGQESKIWYPPNEEEAEEEDTSAQV